MSNDWCSAWDQQDLKNTVSTLEHLLLDLVLILRKKFIHPYIWGFCDVQVYIHSVEKQRSSIKRWFSRELKDIKVLKIMIKEVKYRQKEKCNCLSLNETQKQAGSEKIKSGRRGFQGCCDWRLLASGIWKYADPEAGPQARLA